MNMKDSPHVVLPLSGNFKGEQGIPRCYLRRVVIESKSGLDIASWVERASWFEMDQNRKYLFAFIDGTKQKEGVYEEYLFRKLESVYVKEEGYMSKGIKIKEAYGISRSFWRSSITEATNANNDECNDKDIERNIRWGSENKQEQSKLQWYKISCIRC